MFHASFLTETEFSWKQILIKHFTEEFQKFEEDYNCKRDTLIRYGSGNLEDAVRPLRLVGHVSQSQKSFVMAMPSFKKNSSQLKAVFGFKFQTDEQMDLFCSHMFSSKSPFIEHDGNENIKQWKATFEDPFQGIIENGGVYYGQVIARMAKEMAIQNFFYIVQYKIHSGMNKTFYFEVKSFPKTLESISEIIEQVINIFTRSYYTSFGIPKVHAVLLANSKNWLIDEDMKASNVWK